MIEIISNEKSHTVTCNKCGSVLRYTDSDKEQLFHKYGIYCPNCDNFIATQVYKPFQYPQSFVGKNTTETKHLSETEVQELIDDCVNKLKESKREDGYDWTVMSTGDTFVYSVVDDEGIEIYVTQDYVESYYEY